MILNCQKQFFILELLQILSGTDGVELILQNFIEKHPQISCDSLVKCLLMISDDDKVTREFTDALLLLSDENKINILRFFIIF